MIFFYNKKTILLVSLSFLAIFLGLLVIGYRFYLDSIPEKSVEEYVKILRGQEKILDGEEISEEQLSELHKCDNRVNKARCLAEYYREFNDKNGMGKTFSNLALLMKNYPEYDGFCHMIAHGIGHSQLGKDGDFVLALFNFFKGNYYKNISTCGSGFVHGLLEESVKDFKTDQEIITFFKKTCEVENMREVLGRGCVHGLGHAALIQFDMDIEKAISVCKEVKRDEFDEFECYTGVFMELVLSENLSKIVKKEGSSLRFELCDKYSNPEEKLIRNACIFETAIALQNFVDPDEKGNKFSKAIGLCQALENSYERYICVKNISIRAITDDGEDNLRRMCLENTRSSAERVYCVYVYSYRLALGITNKQDAKFFKIGGDICKNLSYFEARKCQSLLNSKVNRSYFLREDDLTSL